MPWGDLASADAPTALRAVAAWANAPDAAVVACRNLAASAPDPALVMRLVADLAAPDSATREAASAKLRELGPDARAELTRAAESPNPEVAGRARALLAAGSPRVPVARAVDVLKGADSPACWALLREWADAGGKPGQLAAAALARRP